jgi:hypothetical protein
MKGMPFRSFAAMLGALLASPALSQETAFLSTDLFGDYVPGGGVKDATGDFNGEIDLAKSRMCYYLEVADLADADAAGIYEGEKSKNGPAVVPLALPREDKTEVCASVDKELLQAMTKSPANYYVAVSSPAHPNGAIRGQLGE